MAEDDNLIKGSGIVFAEMQRVTEPVNGVVKIDEYQNGQRKVIHVGNTGLKVAIDHLDNGKIDINADYEPQGKSSHDPENQIKFTTLFGYSLSKLIDWAKNSKQAEQIGLNNATKVKFKSLSQPELAILIKKMFDKYGHPELLQEVGSQAQYKWLAIDFNALISLQDQDPLKQQLRAMEERGSRLTVTYDKAL